MDNQDNGLDNVGALHSKGVALHNLGRHAEAASCYEKALIIARRISDQEGEAVVLDSLGSVHHKQGNYSMALECYTLALNYAIHSNQAEMKATILCNTGNVFDSLENLGKALKCYLDALEVSTICGNLKSRCKCAGNVANIYAQTGRQEQAIVFYNVVLECSRKLKDKFIEGITLDNIGLAYENLYNDNRAAEYYTKALSIFKAILGHDHEQTRATEENLQRALNAC